VGSRTTDTRVVATALVAILAAVTAAELLMGRVPVCTWRRQAVARRVFSSENRNTSATRHNLHLRRSRVCVHSTAKLRSRRRFRPAGKPHRGGFVEGVGGGGEHAVHLDRYRAAANRLTTTAIVPLNSVADIVAR
jgi:hypothetical protein